MKFIFQILFFFAFLNLGYSQQFWKEIKESEMTQRGNKVFQEMPESYKTFQLDHSDLRFFLQDAPMIHQDFSRQQFIELQMPNLEGGTQTYLVFEQPVMEAGLSQKYPDLKAYKGISKVNPKEKIWFTVSPFGYSGALSTEEGTVYIDAYYENNKEYYITYNVDKFKNNPYAGVPLCGVETVNSEKPQAFMPYTRSTAEVETREYRLAMACTGEWGKIRVTVAKCLSDMNIMVTRLTQIYESELAIRFVLVNDNDKVIFLDPATDPYIGSDMAKTILPTNTGILNDRIGANNYDIGHVLSICFDVGGVAMLGSACQSNKGNGVTCFNNQNFEYAVASIMAHEVGHQFNASHTFNSCAPSQENVSPGTAYEPGSGSTIMSYGGLCGVDDIFNGNNAYFHVASLEQMFGKTLSGGNAYSCATKIASGNRIPEVIMPVGGFTIPISTPFELRATGTDEDGDNLTYRWEQYNLGPQSTLGNPVGTAPLFRSFPSVSSPTRFFPTKERIFKNQFNAKDEVLPTITRDLKFKCVVRDEKAVGVGVTWGEMNFSVTADAGPFSITYPKVDAKFDVGDEITVTWSVANTDVAPVNCKLVNIYVSYNEALLNNDPDMILVANQVPNNGARKIIIPNKLSNRANFVIKAADNIFLTTSVLPSIIQNPVNPGIFVDVAEDYRKLCLPASPEFVFETAGLSGLTENIHFEVVSGLPSGAIPIFSADSIAPGSSTTLKIDMNDVEGKGMTEVVVRAFVPGLDTLVRYLRINYTATRLDEFTTLTPSDGTTGGSVLPMFSWTSNTDASTYQFQLAKNPSFSTNSLVFERTVGVTSFTSSVILEKSNVYYWRVRAINECKEGAWSEIKAFSTEVLSCKEFKSGELAINISPSGRPVVETSLDIPIEGVVSDLNVTKIRCDHQRNGDIIASVISPSNKEIVLWSKKCGTQKNIVIGIDDQSPIFFGCPLSTDRIVKPDIPLAGFNGENVKGVWTLRITDDEPGEGGRLLEFNMEICSNLAVAAPSLLVNEVLQIPPGDKPSIRPSHLMAIDEDNTPDQLIFTIVSLPRFGILKMNGVDVVIGSTLTQEDINQDKLRYFHDGSSNPTDSFEFTVIDGQGGWIPITAFEMEIDASFPSKTTDLSKQINLMVYPNPVGDQELHVVINDEGIQFSDYIIFDVNGRKCASGKMIENKTSIQMSTWTSGVYRIQLYSKEGTVSSIFMKQ
ncbi:MAG: reprolysin-like metallopeptidase [Saprospiraceae bacterium]